MGGSGGGRYIRDRDLNTLARIARENIREAVQPTRRNIFISFAREDLQVVNALRAQAKNEMSYLEFSDRSLPEPFNSKDAEYIKRGIRDRIKQSSVTLCFLSEDSSRSDWVNWEIEESLKLGKGVVAMYQGDKPPQTLPQAVKNNDIKIVQWNQSEITNAINEAARER